MIAAIVLAAVLGLFVGSFLNVAVDRLPRGERLRHPGSHCPSCGHETPPYDSVVLSWLILRGRCRGCGNRVAVRTPLLEALTAALWAAVVVVTWDDPAQLALGLVLVTLMVAVVPIDLEHRLILDKMTYPSAVLAVIIGLVLDPGALPEQLIAGAAAGGFFLLAALASPTGMGLGDVKLAAVMGLLLGRNVAPAILIALVAGALVGAVVVARRGRGAGVPFGPFLALGSIVSLLVGGALVDAYLETF